MASPAFVEEVALAQSRLSPRLSPYDLPRAAELTFYRVTGLQPVIPAGLMAAPLRWVFAQPAFAIEDLIAEFEGHDPEALRKAVEAAVKAGALARVV